jgi:hypothetical protein
MEREKKTSSFQWTPIEIQEWKEKTNAVFDELEVAYQNLEDERARHTRTLQEKRRDRGTDKSPCGS